MKNIKQTALKLLAKAGANMAAKSAGSASAYGYHQPKEPQGIMSVYKSKRDK